MNKQEEDPSAKIEQFLKHILLTLDTDFVTSSQRYQNNPQAFQASILPQLNPQSAVIINGQPFGERAVFQSLWANLPASQHTLLSFDTHLIPAIQPVYVINAHLKVRFDESGRTRLGDSSEKEGIMPPQPATATRPIWGPWFGVDLNLAVDSKVNQSFDGELISTWNWRTTSKSEGSAYSI
ncbi:unnamed protein product [Kuraishia capsulata CBS 1993]|uniref:mRNA transport regulator MTR2 n=1 Tax=Kuraishia capsulata CBS 1993 TaxID=1382522 RepID=W6MIK8_9ASCO|nr:uncharacterized protein KUCA_T00000157001 [Kuraishia capsulata CBS 1993]CDK24197.1 unnamed protein product [Kuraishia capsulata CBS 1993]